MTIPAERAPVAWPPEPLTGTRLKAEWRRTSVGKELFLPYARILPMHIAIILGAMVGGAAGVQSAAVAVVLVVLKMLVDLATHILGHLVRNTPEEHQHHPKHALRRKARAHR